MNPSFIDSTFYLFDTDKMSDLDKHFNALAENLKAISKIVSENSDEKYRYAYYPLKSESEMMVNQFYQTQISFMWFAHEITSYKKDIKDYQSLTPAEKHLMDGLISFILVGDGGILEMMPRFILEAPTAQSRSFYYAQQLIEQVHSESYATFALNFFGSDQKVDQALEQIMTTPCIMKKMEFMKKWNKSADTQGMRFVAQACAEGIGFCNLFALIYWFRSRGMFDSFIFLNELVSRDEMLHRDFAIFRANETLTSADRESGKIVEIIKDFVEIEDDYVDYLLPTEISDLRPDDVKVFARLMADHIIVALGGQPIYKVINRCKWAEGLSLDKKSNFFERNTGSYSRPFFDYKKVTNAQSDANYQDFDVDF